MSRDVLIRSIAGKIIDYRQGEIGEMTPAHVNRWVSQFHTSEQLIILREINHILDQFYFSKEVVKNYIRSFFNAENVFGNNPREKIARLNFLRIQKNGCSQEDILKITDQILQEEFGLTLEECGGSNEFLYIDDCVYTGNRYRYDLVPWIANNNLKPKSKLFTLHIAQHTSGYEYALKHIRRAARLKDIEVSPWYFKQINNARNNGACPEVMWPYVYTEDVNVNNYYQRVVDRCNANGWRNNAFRDSSFDDENLFTNAEARNVVERAFLKEGARLILAAENPAESMRPLGFEKLESLGFGSVFVTFRNISNNCPLVLWFGDPDSYGIGILGMWYPLFPRKTNGQGWDWEDIF